MSTRIRSNSARHPLDRTFGDPQRQANDWPFAVAELCDIVAVHLNYIR